MKQINTNENNLFSRNIIELKLITDRIAEGKGDESGIFSNTYQVLYILEKKDVVTPREIIKELNIAKSNLAILAKKMIRDGQIESHKDLVNRREIYYNITPLGREQLKSRLDFIDNSCDYDTRKITALLSKTVDELKKLESKTETTKKKKLKIK